MYLRCSERNLPELGMQLRSLGTEVLPYRIGALTKYRQYILVSTDIKQIYFTPVSQPTRHCDIKM